MPEIVSIHGIAVGNLGAPPGARFKILFHVHSRFVHDHPNFGTASQNGKIHHEFQNGIVANSYHARMSRWKK